MKALILFRLVDLILLLTYILLLGWQMIRTIIGKSKPSSTSKSVST